MAAKRHIPGRRLALLVAALLTLATAGGGARAFATATTPTCGAKLAFQSHIGLCKAGSVTARYAEVHYPLSLQTLLLSFVSWRQTKQLASSFSTKKSGTGTFLVLTVKVTNETKAPNNYEDQQTELIIGRTVYTESLPAEDGPDQHSLLWEDDADAGLPAGKTETGDMVFDVPSSAITQFKEGDAALVIGDYGTSVTGSQLPAGVGLMYF